MADGTKIEWTDASWQVITGCSVTSPGCTNCYAMRLAGTRLRHHPSRVGLTRGSKAGPVWTGETRFNEQWLTQPLGWRRPRHIFVCAHGDLFHESVPDEWIDRVFAVMALAPKHTFQVLTKRAWRMREYLSGGPWGRIEAECVELIDADVTDVWTRAQAATSIDRIPLPNVWLGVSVEDQARANERIPDLLATPAAVRWISAEPLLGPVDLTDVSWGDDLIWGSTDALMGVDTCHEFPGEPRPARAKLDWVVVGGESGIGARPMHPDWARSLRDQCATAGVKYFFKQWGDWSIAGIQAGGDLGGDMRAGRVRHVCGDRKNDGHFRRGDVHMRRVGKALAGRLLDGVEHNAMPDTFAKGPAR